MAVSPAWSDMCFLYVQKFFVSLGISDISFIDVIPCDALKSSNGICSWNSKL